MFDGLTPVTDGSTEESEINLESSNGIEEQEMEKECKVDFVREILNGILEQIGSNQKRIGSNNKRIGSNDKRIESNHKRIESNNKRIESNHKRIESSHKRIKSNHKRIKSNCRRIQSNHKRIDSNDKRFVSNDDIIGSNMKRIGTKDVDSMAKSETRLKINDSKDHNELLELKVSYESRFDNKRIQIENKIQIQKKIPVERESKTYRVLLMLIFIWMVVRVCFGLTLKRLCRRNT